MTILIGFLAACVGTAFYRMGRRDGEARVLQGMAAFFLRGQTSITIDPGAREILNHHRSQAFVSTRWGKNGMEIVIKEYLAEVSDMGEVQIVSGKDGSLSLQRKGDADDRRRTTT